MLKFVSLVALLAAVGHHRHEAFAQDATTQSSFQNFFKKVQEVGSNVDLAKLSAGAIKAQQTFGPLLSQFKNASQPVMSDLQKQFADTGLVPTTTANPVGSVLKNLQVVGIGSDIDVAKVQENARKAQETLGPLFSQFSSFVSKKTSGGESQQPVANRSPLDEFIIEDPKVAAAAPAVVITTSAPPKSNDFQSAIKSIQDAGSKIDIAQVQEGAKKISSFFSQFKKSGA